VPKVDDRYREEARNKVIVAALDVFSRKGYHDAKMDEIAEKASVSKGTLYNQFSSKEDLFRGIAEYLLKVEMKESVALLGEGDPVRQFKALYDWMNELYGSKASFILEVYSIACRDRKMHDILSRVIKKENEGFAQLIAFMQAEGRIRRDVDPRQLSYLLMSMYLGLMICGALDGGPTCRPEDLLDIGLRSVLFEYPAVK
jgi:AcrR family transcriptional regulator